MSPPPYDDFDELYRAHGGRLVVQLFAYTQDLALAEDLVQEAFCRALARWSRVAAYEEAFLPISDFRRTRCATGSVQFTVDCGRAPRTQPGSGRP